MSNPDGSCKLDSSYNAILDLHQKLKAANIPHELKRQLDGWEIIYPEDGYNRLAHAIEHCASYGSEIDTIEVMGEFIVSANIKSPIEGFLASEEVFERIKNHWEANSVNYEKPTSEE